MMEELQRPIVEIYSEGKILYKMYIKHIFVVDSSIERHKVGHSMLLDKQFPASLIIYFLFVNSSHLPSMLPVKSPKLMITDKTSLDSVSLSFQS